MIAALAEAKHTGWDGLVRSQREFLDDFWERADVEIEGDTELQQAVRFALFHVLQAGARAEGRALPAKGLTGSGYDGHAFWDTESFVLPVLTYTHAKSAADALRWRHSTLDLARDRARQLGSRGRGLPVAHDRRPGVLGLLAGRHGGRSTSTPTSPTPSSATTRRRATRRSSASAAWSSWSRRPGCGGRWATTTCTAASASTGSPGRTSTAPSADDNVYTNLMAAA